MSGDISFSEMKICLHQIQVQERAVELEILRLELDLKPESPPGQFQLRDNLKVIRSSLRIARRDLQSLTVRRKSLWDVVKIMVYNWAMRGRFE